MNVVRILGTANSEAPAERRPAPGCDPSLSFLSGDRLLYATNLIKDWHAQLLHYDGLKPKSAKAHRENMFRLLNHARVAPWELRKEHVTQYLDSRVNMDTGETLAPATVAARFSSWRSLQAFMLEPDRVNEILAQFRARPARFINDENGIAVKKHKAHWVPKGWALTPEQIDAIDETFRTEILQAHRTCSKSLRPLQRDRAMFHVCIHFALRISELVTLCMSQFAESHDPRLKRRFGRLGVLTVSGKNDVSGSIPMREPDVHALLEWYLTNCRQRILMNRQSKGNEDNGRCEFEGEHYKVADLVFPSERGSVINPNAFRKRLADIAMKAGVLDRKLIPHTLRHTGCTLMVPIYSPEVAQRYMRHKNLYTTLHYYHPTPLDAANEANAPYTLFADEENDEGEGS